jgi:hypothetical protein
LGMWMFGYYNTLNYAYPVSTGPFASAEFVRLCPLS